MKHVVCGDRIVVKVQAPKEKTVGGIIVGPIVEEPRQEGEVVAVGRGKYIEENDICVGQRVLFRKMAGVSVKIDEVDYVVMEADEVYMKFAS